MNKTLTDLAVISYGKDYKSNPKGDEIPILGTGGIMGFTSLKLNSGPAILTGRKGSINNPLFIEGDFWNVDTIFCVKSTEGIDPKWLYYNFQNTNLLLLNEATGVPSVSASNLYRLEFKYFELPQQRKIARILSTCDEVIEKTEAAIAKYQALKQGMMHDLFTRGIDVKTGKLRPSYQDAPELYTASELGMIPKEWEVLNFEEATEIITDFTANGSFESLRINVKYYYEVNYGRLIRLTDLRQNLKTDGVYVDKSGFDYLSKSALKENDIMLANVGEYTGFACLMPKVNYPATMAPNMFLVRTNQELFDSKFMYYFMTYPSFTNQVDNVSASSATKLLNKTNFRAMHLPKPKIDEQKLFGKSLESLNEKLQTEQTALAKYQQLKAGLMQDLLTGKVAVSVGEEVETIKS